MSSMKSISRVLCNRSITIFHQKGQPGNPAGKPKGAKDKRVAKSLSAIRNIASQGLSQFS